MELLTVESINTKQVFFAKCGEKRDFILVGTGRIFGLCRV